MNWINTIITALCSLLAAVGGGSIIYVKQNRAMKETEIKLKEKEIKAQEQTFESNEINQWKELYQEVKSENKRLSEKIDELYKQQHQLTKQVAELQAIIGQHTCLNIDCKKRIRYNCSNEKKTNA